MQDEIQDRLVVHFEGNVQGVGFRFQTRELAAGFAVNGTVENLDDGRVRLIVEGTTSAVNSFLEEVRRKMSRYISRFDVTKTTGTGEFVGFQVKS